MAVARDPDWYDTPAVEAGDKSSTQIRISRGTTENPLFPKLSEAWNAFQAADYTRAETLYREVQAADAANVDAMLGLAAIALRSGREQEAQSLYNAVLEADPQNAAAIAALSTLPAGAISQWRYRQRIAAEKPAARAARRCRTAFRTRSAVCGYRTLARGTAGLLRSGAQ